MISAESSVRDVGALARSLADAGMESCLLSVQDPEVTLDRPDRLRRPIEMAVVLGVRSVRVHAPRWAGGDPDGIVESVGTCAELCGAAGLKLLLEVAPGTAIPSPDLVRKVIAAHPSGLVGALYDPGNMVIEGNLAPELAVRLLGPRLAHVHVKNVSWMRARGKWRWRHAALGAGLVDWAAVFDALRGAGYSGWLSIDHLDGPADELLLRRFAEDARTLAGAGLRPLV
jgi:sugar phosphate isomerase/epimerase